jgi:hypothetical protein
VLLTQTLAKPLAQLQDAARAIAAVTREAGLECDEDAYLGSFRPTLMDVFHQWSQGKSFAEVRRARLAIAAAWCAGGGGGGAGQAVRTTPRHTHTHTHVRDHTTTRTINQTRTHPTHPHTRQVAPLTDIFEGSIIRVARRLDELMRQARGGVAGGVKGGVRGAPAHAGAA